MFSGNGPLLKDGLASHTRAQGGEMDEFDIVIDPTGHDMRRPANQRPVIDDCESGVYGYGHLGIPCTTFTTILALQRRVLRTRGHPHGRPGLSGRDKVQVDEHNLLIRFAVEVATAIIDSGGEVTLENVGDRGDPSLPEMYWPERASMCSLALVPEIIALVMYGSMVLIHLPLCSFHDHHVLPLPPVKWVTFFATPRAAAMLAPLQLRRCPTPWAKHGSAVGRQADGTSRAALSASYPSECNRWLAMVAVQFAGDGRGAAEPSPVGAQIGCAPALSPPMAEAVASHRSRLPRFADLRKLRAVPMERRRLMAYPLPEITQPEFEPAPHDDDWDFCPSDEGDVDDERPSTFPAGVMRPIRAHHGIPGLPPGRVTYEMIWRRVPESGGARVGLDLINGWTTSAFESAPLLMQGEPHAGPGTITLDISMKEPWARLILLDTRDPTDVVRMRRSTRDTVFAGPLQIDRAALRAMATEVDWYDIDPDILGQIGEGGLEARSSCPRHSIFSWHHNGVREHFDAAHKISVQELEDEWIIGPFPMPPTEPCRCIPNNVIMQHRAKVDEDGNFHPYLKPRVTTNESFGDEDSPNAGVSQANRTTSNPSHQTHAASSSITHSCYRAGGVDGAQYVTDLTSAFSFGQQQRTDWWLQVRFWIVRRPSGVQAGYYICHRLLFGGTWGPNRFNRVRRIKTAWTRKRQTAFDRAHPPPQGVLDAIRERSLLQRSGRLPGGVEQLVAASLQGFIDDESGSAGTDLVPMPSELAHIDVATILARTASSGATPAPVGSRVVVHCAFSILSSERMGFIHAMDKVQCGDDITVLGIRASVRRDASDCPPAKSTVMVAELRDMRATINAEQQVRRDAVQRNVGRLSNISQIAPQLLLHLHAGYALACAHQRSSGGGHRARLRLLTVKPHGRVGKGFVSLIDSAITLLESGCAVPLLCEPAFPDHGTSGVLTVCSDASGEDGVGGFAIHPSSPEEVWLVHGPWTPLTRAALAHSSRTPRQRVEAGHQPRCSMPAAELFGPWLIAASLAREGLLFESVISIMDCKPAVSAITLTKSRSRVMRGIVGLANETATSWLGVHVRREHNTDCDRLSHPSEVQTVVSAAALAGLTVHVVAAPDDLMAQLDRLIVDAFAADSCPSACMHPAPPLTACLLPSVHTRH